MNALPLRTGYDLREGSQILADRIAAAQLSHPSEQDGLISGKYLDRIYDSAWWASKTTKARDTFRDQDAA